jgi:hypothetical protein
MEEVGARDLGTEDEMKTNLTIELDDNQRRDIASALAGRETRRKATRDDVRGFVANLVLEELGRQRQYIESGAGPYSRKRLDAIDLAPTQHLPPAGDDDAAEAMRRIDRTDPADVRDPVAYMKAFDRVANRKNGR